MSTFAVRFFSKAKNAKLPFLPGSMPLLCGTSIRDKVEKLDSQSAVEQPNVATEAASLWVSGNAALKVCRSCKTDTESRFSSDSSEKCLSIMALANLT